MESAMQTCLSMAPAASGTGRCRCPVEAPALGHQVWIRSRGDPAKCKTRCWSTDYRIASHCPARHMVCHELESGGFLHAIASFARCVAALTSVARLSSVQCLTGIRVHTDVCTIRRGGLHDLGNGLQKLLQSSPRNQMLLLSMR